MYEMDYFYGSESEMFSFYRIPRVLIDDPRFSSISDSSKLLYGLMLDRMSLSRKNNWVDENNRVFIIFSLQEVMEKLHCQDQKATKLMAELDDKNGVGLVERLRRGMGKPDIIYLKNFIIRPESTEISGFIKNRENHGSGVVKITNQESRKSRIKNRENHDSRVPKITNQEPRKSRSNNTNNNYKYMNDNNLRERDSRAKDRIHLSDEENKLFDTFLEVRKSRGKTTTQTVRDLLIQKLYSLGHDEIERIEIIEKTIVKGWLDFYPMDNGNPLGQVSNVNINQD